MSKITLPSGAVAIGVLLLVGASVARTATPGRRHDAAEDIFAGGAVPRLHIRIPAEGLRILRNYHQVWGQPRPERIDVRVTVREGSQVYTNVAMHLKGSYTFQPIDGKPSFTLNFAKYSPGQRFHGLEKLHLNNARQDPSYLSEALARELFQAAGVPSPRAGHAVVELNGRDLGLFVLIEGWNKQFLKRHFDSAKGNLYDGGSGGDVVKALKVDCGETPENRSDLTNLVAAAREPEVMRRFSRLNALLDVDRFLSFVATEVFTVHWDGYSMGVNNYRVFHDAARDKMVFMPHGLDQLFGVGGSPTLTITPHMNGLVARALLATPEGRRRYLDRMGSLVTNEFGLDKVTGRIQHLADQLRPALASNPEGMRDFEQAVRNLRSRVGRRIQSVEQQLGRPQQPLQFAPDGLARLSGWTFKSGLTQAAGGQRTRQEGQDVLQVVSMGPGSAGSWRTLVLLEAGHYEFTGRARTVGLAGAQTPSGVLLRISGERATKGITPSPDWTRLTYEFDVVGASDVELVCEFRGRAGSGLFDAGSLRLCRKGPPSGLTGDEVTPR